MKLPNDEENYMYQYQDLYTIDFTNIKYYLEIHKTIQKALDWPDYYGCNWDAFWDCLTNMVGRQVHIKILGWDVIEQNFCDDAKIMVDILKEFKHYRNDKYAHEIQIEIVNGNTHTKIQ